MPFSYLSERMSGIDALLLYLERPETPINIGCTSIFDGPVSLDALVRFVESKLPLIPRYRQRLVVPPFNVAHPTWEYDPDFDIRHHIHHAVLKRGSETELQDLAGQIFSSLLDREKPLWDMTLVDGLRGGRSAIIARVHHCVVDGVGGVGLMNVLLDASPEPPPQPRIKRFKAPPLPDSEASLTAGLMTSYSDLLERIAAIQMAGLNLVEVVLENGMGMLDQLMRLVPELLTPVERLPFNRPCLGPRKAAWTEFPIAKAKAIKKVCGGTLNDVVLTLVTGAVRRYAELHGTSVENRQLRMFVPVNLRRRHSTGNGLGNCISIMPVNVPLGITDPVKLLEAVRQKTEALKSAHVADLIYLVGTWLGMIPTPLQALSGPLSVLVTEPVFNLVCTNVPGPEFPLYLLGRKMLTYYPYVPIGNEWGIGCAIQSYDRKLYFGLTADSVAAPDVARLSEFLELSFSELCRATGVAAARSRRPRPRPSPAPEEKVEPVAPVPVQPVQAPAPEQSVQAPTPEQPGAAAEVVSAAAATAGFSPPTEPQIPKP